MKRARPDKKSARPDLPCELGHLCVSLRVVDRVGKPGNARRPLRERVWPMGTPVAITDRREGILRALFPDGDYRDVSERSVWMD